MDVDPAMTLTDLTAPDNPPVDDGSVISLLHRDENLTVSLVQPPHGDAYTITQVSERLAESDQFVDEFERSMALAARLKHPAILPVLDFGVRDGVPFVTNPYVTRGSFAPRIGLNGALTLERTAEAISQLAEAIDFAHEQDILHGGITAQTALRGADNQVMLSGFGLFEPIYQAAGLTPAVLPYAAPELLLKAPYTSKVDIYAFGILAYQMLSGSLPFVGTTTTQFMYAHLRLNLPAQAGISHAVYDVLRRATSSVSHARHWTAMDFARELVRAAGLEARPLAVKISLAARVGLKRYRTLQAAPVRQTQRVKLSQLYIDAMLCEQDSPEKARQMYHQILSLWPRMAQGDILDKSVRLDREMMAAQAPALLSQARKALNRGDWPLLLQLSLQTLEAESMKARASTMVCADEHYQAALIAERLGDTPAAVELTQELLQAVPTYNDWGGLTVIEPRRAGYVRALTSQPAHTGNVLAMGISRDGRLLASGSTDKSAQIAWLPRLNVNASLEKFHSWVCALSFSPDGEYLLTGLWDGEIRLWSLPDGEYKGMIAGFASQMQALAFAHHQPDLIAVASGNFLTMWQIPSGERQNTIRETDLQSVSALAYSTTQSHLICGMTNGSLRIRDAADPQYAVLKDIPVHQSVVHGLACLPDGERVVSISHYDTVRVTDLRRGTRLFSLSGHEGSVLDVACAPQQGWIATGGSDGTVRLWDGETGHSLAVLTGHEHGVSRVCISPDERLVASADASGTIRLWRI